MLGVGLIGGSIGLAARRRADAHVCGYDPNRRACAAALELGAIDEQAPDIAAAVASAQVVFAAAPVGVLAQTVREALALAGADCVVSDVGSTKLALHDAREDPRFVGGHPLAGAETAGVENAREDLFEGATWYLTPAPSTNRALYERLERVIELLGARPAEIAADAHDRVMASVSHLPHVLANVLVAQAAEAFEREGCPTGGRPQPARHDQDRRRQHGDLDRHLPRQPRGAERGDRAGGGGARGCARRADPRGRRCAGGLERARARRPRGAAGRRLVVWPGMNVRFEPSGPLTGELTAPADKSISHRAALLGAMASYPVRIENYLHAADTTSTLDAARALGALVEVRPDAVVVRGAGLREAREPGGPIDVGNAGTLLRLLPGWLAAQEGRSFTLDGDESIRRRPVDRVIEPLRLMGAGLDAREGRYSPLRVRGARLHSISYTLPVASAQVKSCVLLAALAADGASTVTEPERSRDHTERILLSAGVASTATGAVSPSPTPTSWCWSTCGCRATRAPPRS